MSLLSQRLKNPWISLVPKQINTPSRSFRKAFYKRSVRMKDVLFKALAVVLWHSNLPQNSPTLGIHLQKTKRSDACSTVSSVTQSLIDVTCQSTTRGTCVTNYNFSQNQIPNIREIWQIVKVEISWDPQLLFVLVKVSVLTRIACPELCSNPLV